MTNEQINIAIAEACGWRWVTRRQQEGLRDDVRGYPPNVECVGLNERYVPDYCKDLNAMHEAEKVLNDEQKIAYATCLNALHPIADILYPDQQERGWKQKLYAESFCLIHATSRQRAEAFLRTIGKLED